MSHWGTIRALARGKRDELFGSGTGLLPAEQVARRALDAVGLDLLPVPPGDPLLAGAQALLHRDAGAIIHDVGTPANVVWLHVAHELAHYWLHDEPAACGSADLAPDPVTDPLPYGEDYVSGYSPAQRRELEANVYAAELLLPGPLVRDAFLSGLTAAAISEQAGVPELSVVSQLDALISGGTGEGAAPAPSPSTEGVLALDESQAAAAVVERGPVLVTAGPGTGKTRTLVGRALHLVNRGVQPDHILALTFSNRAAGEMRERLALSAPEAARRMWIGTFHAFGLELLRRWGTGIGLPPSPVVLDPADAVPLAERHLARLGLREYEYLANPLYPLPDLLAAVSRAKDELVPPGEYRQMAQQMADAAGDEQEAHEAARALEVARFYEVWQGILAEQGMLDFGDLIYRAVGLFRDHPGILDEVRSQYRHQLVDEYQDINRGSAVLLKLLAGDGEGLWAVGDVRQAIYRFRGASPANVARFTQDYPEGRMLPLAVNYRSREPLVRLFTGAAGKLAAAPGEPAPAWISRRPAEQDAFIIAEAEDEFAQADGIAASVARFAERGIAFKDQAGLCRTNAQAEELSSRLEERGVPVLYLGDLFARSEVRDMLALLSLAAGEGRGAGLLRVARFPEYDVPRADVETALNWAKEHNALFPAALSTCGIASLSLPASHIEALAWAPSAYLALVRYLTGPADYLRSLLISGSPGSRQRLLALHQLLMLARAFAARPEPAGTGAEASATLEPARPLRAFLTHVRRLIATRADTRARVPAGAEEVDAVRLMTVHGSKGLEFPVVFLPNLSKGLFPARGGSSLVKLPRGLAGGPESDEAEEDERLFFVALSRARDHLVLSRPRSFRGRTAEPSPLLKLIEGSLDAAGAQHVVWSGGRRPAAPASVVPMAGVAPDPAAVADTVPSASGLEDYMACPRRYYYGRVLGLRASDDVSAYQAFQRCVWDTLQWLRRARHEGAEPTADQAVALLSDRWKQAGPVGHPHEPVLRARADEMVARAAADAPSAAPGKPAPEELTVDLAAGRVRVRADHAEQADDGTLVVERYDTGQPRDEDHRAPRLALLRQAARQAAGAGEAVEVRVRYLATGEERSVPEAPRYEPARVEKYNRALEALLGGRFDAAPSQECDRCPFLFICPA